MKTSLVLALLGACVPSVHAVVHFPFAKHTSPPHNVAKGGSKPRALNEDFFLGAMTYVVNATVGTPGQPVSLVLSTDSSDTWVVDARSEECTYPSDYYGSYSDSDTYDSDDYYTESFESCIWGSCKSSPSSDGRPTRSRSRICTAPEAPPGALPITESYSTGGECYGLDFRMLIPLQSRPMRHPHSSPRPYTRTPRPRAPAPATTLVTDIPTVHTPMETSSAM